MFDDLKLECKQNGSCVTYLRKEIKFKRYHLETNTNDNEIYSDNNKNNNGLFTTEKSAQLEAKNA